MMKPSEQQIINQMEDIRTKLEAANRPGLRCIAVVLDMLEDEDPDYARAELERMHQNDQIPDGLLDLGMAILNSKSKLTDGE